MKTMILCCILTVGAGLFTGCSSDPYKNPAQLQTGMTNSGPPNLIPEPGSPNTSTTRAPVPAVGAP